MSKKRSKKRTRQPNLPEDAQRAAISERSAVKAGGRGFSPDYTYVIQDLKRIGVLAGSFIVILVVLSFFLR